MTAGMVGADLANLINEAALLAVRRDKARIGMAEVEEAVERVVAGLEKKNRLINAEEKEIVAYHELGHALVAMALPGTDPVAKNIDHSSRHCRAGLHHAGADRGSISDAKNRTQQSHCDAAGRQGGRGAHIQ
jgi:ATP-dependent Zn protease